MILANEVAAIEDKLKQQASRKERALYQRLISDPLPYPYHDKLNDIEQVCLSAFCTDAPNKIDLVERFRRRKPIKGIHYANNIVELAAFALYDCNSEADHLKSFCSSCSARDHLILNQLFPGVCTSRPSTTSAIDTIALWLENGSFPSDWGPVLLDAIQNANDLLDLYVLRNGYMHLWEHHPSTEQTRDLRHLSNQLQRVISHIEGRSSWWFNTIAATIIVVVFAGIAYFAIRHWDVAEPVIWASTVGVGVVVFLMLLFFGMQLDKVHMIEQAREKRARTALRKAGLDIERIGNITRKYMEAGADISKVNAAMITKRSPTPECEPD